MFDDILDFMGFLAKIIGIFGFGVLTIAAVIHAHAYVIERPACADFQRITDQETFWSLGTGCIVKYNGEWVDYSVATKKKQEITVKQK